MTSAPPYTAKVAISSLNDASKNAVATIDYLKSLQANYAAVRKRLWHTPQRTPAVPPAPESQPEQPREEVILSALAVAITNHKTQLDNVQGAGSDVGTGSAPPPRLKYWFTPPEPIEEEPPPSAVIPISAILSAVCTHYRMPLNDLIAKRRDQPRTRARWVAIWLARHMTTLSFVKIGRNLGGMDHSSVLNALRRMPAVLETEDNIRRDLLAITKTIVERHERHLETRR